MEKGDRTKRPNIVFILTDDQGYWSLGCYGNQEIRTPNLDRLAEHGVRFENFFCVSPVCSPARASLMTGRIPSQHGVHDYLCGGNGGAGQTAIEYLKGQRGYTDILAENGYTCGLSGKWHLGDNATRKRDSVRLFFLVHSPKRRRPLLQCSDDSRWKTGRRRKIHYGCHYR